MITVHSLEASHVLVRTQDRSGFNAVLAEGAVFRSPVVRSPRRSRRLACWFLSAAFHVFFDPTFRYVREVVGPSDAMPEFETEIEGTLVNGVDPIKWNESGQIEEFKVMLMPLEAIEVIYQRMASMLQSVQRARCRVTIRCTGSSACAAARFAR